MVDFTAGLCREVPASFATCHVPVPYFPCSRLFWSTTEAAGCSVAFGPLSLHHTVMVILMFTFTFMFMFTFVLMFVFVFTLMLMSCSRSC